MLRITKTLETKDTVRLRLDGTISTETLAELVQVCAPHQCHSGQTLILDMAGVSFIDHDTAQKIAGMRTDSVRIINCSPFIAALLDMAKGSMNSSSR
jgi:anti-anti-sigma regulatory factor